MTDHPLTPLCELARKYGTDKGGWHLKAGETCHNYTPTYHALYKDRRETVKHVLEIGVHYGPSVRMWEEYFPNAQIIGLDSNAAALFHEGRIKCYAADQGNEASLLKAMYEAGYDPLTPGSPLFDLIVDDGSHELHHQILSARVLMPWLAPGGHYIIEDLTLDCQPWIAGDRVGHPWGTYDCGVGLGKAHCDPNCERCHGVEGERLLAFSKHG